MLEHTDSDDLIGVADDAEVNERFLEEFERILIPERDRIFPRLPCTDTEVF